MTRWLLRGMAVLSFLVAAPVATAQYIYFDTNGDGRCDANDFMGYSGLDTAEVWIDTSKNGDGSPASCSSGEPLTMASYELILDAASSYSIVSWTNDRPEFTVQEHAVLAGAVAWIGYTSPGAATQLPPGLYRLGRVAYQPAGGRVCPYLRVVAQTPTQPGAETKFYSQCLGPNLDNYVRLGTDFNDVCGLYAICDPVESTTWGEIKQRYR